ncbi:hypothetical protein SAMN04515671_2963 [Nakamurella panacisegetis]|uniref:Nudix hydrolase domain-containing protein n=1 Tax=Nakamurella panacisegetis TaxID=1090615 RepID=A0A1H0Q3R4_9ACTN|nr:NUDIX hydrolase [Nakamurella panacisegetis]SDP11298.1 hypothetical protein SAMN04515671_2963 [Nakamurella panacisegetis]
MTDQPPLMWRTGSKVVYANDWMQVREDEFERTDGSTGIYGVVDKPDFAIVVAEQDGIFHLVEQFRYPIGRRSWEFPMGGWPPGKSGSSLELAQAELREETGFTAGRWQAIAHLYEAAGFCSQGFDVFHATDLTAGDHAREDSEIDMVQGAFTAAQLLAMILDGTIIDSTTIAAYGMWQMLRTAP